MSIAKQLNGKRKEYIVTCERNSIYENSFQATAHQIGLRNLS